MCFREYSNGGSKRAYTGEHVNAINVFHDVNLTLFLVTNIHLKARSGFYLSTSASIHRI